MTVRRSLHASLFFSLALLGCSQEHADSTRGETTQPTVGDGSPGPDTDGDAGGDGAVCAGVSLEPFTDAQRDDRGPEGLRALRAEAEAATARFEELSRAHGGNYTYTAGFSSWTGFSCDTTITVRDGKVVRRAQNMSFQDWGDEGEAPVEEDWVEEGESVGSHADACHAPRTLAELYTECLEVALCQDPRENNIYLEADAQGVLTTCGVFPRDCADDCYEGLSIAPVVFE